MIILGYLWATLVVGLSLMVSRFFIAPGAERLRLVPITTRRAWFWHRRLAMLMAIGALGWQTIVVLRGLGLRRPKVRSCCARSCCSRSRCAGIAIVWTPRDSETLGLLSPRSGRAFRVLVSFALLLIWLLFLTQATKAALSLLVIGAVPVGLYVLRNAAARLTRGQWLGQG